MIEPASNRFDALDDLWLTQVGQFVTELDHEVGSVSRRSEPVVGAKGEVSSVVLSLSSAGVFTAAVEFFKAWLGRDQTRSLKVSFTADGRVQAFEIDGGLSKEAFDGIVQALAEHLASAV
jgi:hypothetical protein